MSVNKMLKTIVNSCEETKAEDIIVLDMAGLSPLTEYFLICEASNERQAQAIAKAIKNDLEEIDYSITRMEGFNEGRWILVDANDVICHIFHKEERGYYNLERLWGDAPEVNVKELK